MKKLIMATLLFAGFAAYSRAAPSGMNWQNGQRLTDTMLQQFDTLKANQTDMNALSGQVQSKVAAINGSLQNPNIQGGSASGMDVSSALANGISLSTAVKQCQTNSPNVYYGAVNSSSQMGDPANTSHLLASGNVMPYFNISGIAGTVYGAGGNINDISGPIGITGFESILAVTGTHGIIELANTQYMTPNVPSKYLQNVLTSDGSQVIDDKSLVSQIGYLPTIAMLNLRRDIDIGVITTSTTYLTDNDVTNFNTAVTDIKSNIPSVNNVWPFINAGDSHDFLTDSYWDSAKTLITSAGGVGIDLVAGVYTLNGPASLAPIIEEIKWANANGIRTVALVSPYSLETPTGYGSLVYPQWRYDAQFLTHVKNLISWLKAADALPTSWSVVNYSPIQYYNPTNETISGTSCTGCTQVTANLMGSDADSTNQTIAYAARWVAENAPTSTYTSMPNMGQQAQPCTSTVLGGYKSSKPVISADQIGLGSLAYVDWNKAVLGYPTIQGAELSGNMNVIGTNALGFGFGAATPAFLGWNTTYGGLTFSGAPVVIAAYNLNLENGADLYSDKGNMVFKGNGVNGINFQSESGNASSWINGDSYGGIVLGNGAYSRVNGTLGLRKYTKAQIIALVTPDNGEIVNDSDDHVPVIYESGHWYPIQLGTALQ